MTLTVIDAPSNLGLRPPIPGSVPGCYKAGWALREAGIFDGIDVHSGGTVVPPRYEAAWSPGQGDRNAEAIAVFSEQLAGRVEAAVDQQRFVVVLGGDCSVFIGVCLGLRRRGRYGAVFVDGHSDFRHPGNAPAIGAAAGEDLAIVTGRGDSRLVNLGGSGPYLADTDVVVVGTRPDEQCEEELGELGVPVWSVERVRATGLDQSLRSVVSHLDGGHLDGIWLHLDVDVLDSTVMPAVDTPSSGGLTMEELGVTLQRIVAEPAVVGLDLCIFDPDLDPTGGYARALARTINTALVQREQS